MRDYSSGIYTDGRGTSVPYQLHLPVKMEPGRKYPVLLFLHGNGSVGTDNRQLLTNKEAELCFKALAEGKECVILAPQARAGWINLPAEMEKGYRNFLFSEAEESDYLKCALSLLKKVIRENQGDESRIYLYGYSRGAMACWYLAAAYPQAFAAAVVCAGCGPIDQISRLIRTPVYAYHGTEDEIVSFPEDRLLCEQIRQAGGEAVFRQCLGNRHGGLGECIWRDGDVLPWLFSKRQVFSEILKMEKFLDDITTFE